MKIGQKFNLLTKEEYFFFIDNYKNYSDFNTLGLYRSIIENEKLDITDKIEVRDYAHNLFQKTFDFFQLKDPDTFFKVSIIGQDITKGDQHKIWNDIKQNQQKILADKKIRHRNFGAYSKHHCGYDWCPYNGLMIRQDSELAETSIHFDSDKNKFYGKRKSDILKKERRNKQQIIKRIIEQE
jgi:hypothetical protein